MFFLGQSSWFVALVADLFADSKEKGLQLPQKQVTNRLNSFGPHPELKFDS